MPLPAWLPVAGKVAAVGATALGSFLTGKSQAQQAAADRAQRAKEFDQTMAQRRAETEAQAQMDRAKYLDTRAGQAVDLQDRLNYAPMADRAAALMAARLGASVEPWQPRDYTQGTMPGSGRASGGVDSQMQAVAAANRAYTPGAGGLNTQEIRSMLDRVRNEQTLPPGYRAPGSPAGVPMGGGGGGGGGARTPEEDALMARFTPYLA